MKEKSQNDAKNMRLKAMLKLQKAVEDIPVKVIETDKDLKEFFE